MSHPARIDATVDQIRTTGAPVRASDVPGLTRARVRAAVAAGSLVVLRPGIVMPTEDWRRADEVTRHRIQIDAALLAFPGSWISHDSAAALHGASGALSRPDWHTTVHLSRPGYSHREDGLIIHGHEVPDAQVISLDGRPVTSLVRTCIDVAARRSTGDALAVMDAGMRLTIAATHADIRRAARLPDLREEVRAEFDCEVACYSRHRWVTTVRQAVRWADPAAESRLESLSRAEILRASLPPPECGFPLYGDDGRLYWTDMWWEHRRLIGEVDGALKYTSPEVLLAEKRRAEALTAPGRFLVRWGFPEVRPQPQIMLRRLRAYL